MSNNSFSEVIKPDRPSPQRLRELCDAADKIAPKAWAIQWMQGEVYFRFKTVEQAGQFAFISYTGIKY
ncbi:hypothetical protein [Bradyrhizobium sp. SYSU BS000235]|uniref:hypothetical protein n=1 Tax=Bradyrhizobium sp. SYSU BS000235 TaxID=3411332 RepID=UPI003C789997